MIREGTTQGSEQRDEVQQHGCPNGAIRGHGQPWQIASFGVQL